MTILTLSAGIFVITGVAALLWSDSRGGCVSRIGSLGGLAAGLLGIAGILANLFGCGYDCRFWGGLDMYSCIFALPVLVVGACAALHAPGYLHGEASGRRLGFFWCFFNLMLAAMLGVTVTQTAFSFLVFWELMGLFSFALVAFEYHEEKTLNASWEYLLACQAGGLLLILVNSLEGNLSLVAGSGCALVILFAGIIAFGLKAGFPLLHVWLPEAHPAAPAPVSAVMSGAMIPLGFLGLLRLGLSAEHPIALGWTLLICGLIAAPFAILLASAQNNLKRLLAYSSVENMGIISMGFGMFYLGQASGNIHWMVLGFCGAVIHILNHAFLKGALFLGAGSILHSTGTLSIDAMGGLFHRLPVTSRYFTCSALSLSGLPPCNGFLGEFLIYASAFAGLFSGNPAYAIVSALVILSLALTGGLAAAVYAKAIGGALLGEPRSKNAAEATEVTTGMTVSLKALCTCSLLMIIGTPFLCRTLASLPIFQQTTTAAATAPFMVEGALCSLTWVCIASAVFAVVTGVFLFLRKTLPHGKEVSTGPTWDCGYAQPTSRMAYTGTALVQPIMDFFAALLRLRRKATPAAGIFPAEASVKILTKDQANHRVWRPLFRITWRLADFIHRFQTGSLHFYILIMVLTLLVVLVCAFCFNTIPQEVVK